MGRRISQIAYSLYRTHFLRPSGADVNENQLSTGCYACPWLHSIGPSGAGLAYWPEGLLTVTVGIGSFATR